jgi:hypothetical protein
MLGRPAALTDVITVALPRPRDRRAPQLARQRAHLLEALYVTGAPAAELARGRVRAVATLDRGAIHDPA